MMNTTNNKFNFGLIEEDSLMDFCLKNNFITEREIQSTTDEEYQKLRIDLEERYYDWYWVSRIITFKNHSFIGVYPRYAWEQLSNLVERDSNHQLRFLLKWETNSYDAFYKKAKRQNEVFDIYHLIDSDLYVTPTNQGLAILKEAIQEKFSYF